ncbi:MAG: c-type cytochrome domain-containing protein, partial [Chloroflexota bacterium]
MATQPKHAPSPVEGSKKEAKRTYVRFALSQRVEHVMMLLSFGTLGVTGLAQKFASHPLAYGFVSLMGGVENVRSIHHTAAIVMMFGTMFHILAAGYKIYVLRVPMSMLPVLQDAKDALWAFLYNIGLRKDRPQMGRFTFEEKAEYWAFVWGAIVMGLTGFLMWNPITASKFLPGEFIAASKAAHGGEAILAVLAIIVWHMYGVHFKHFNTAMWTGRLTEEEMLHEHPLELADIKAGLHTPDINPKILRLRQAAYFPVAGILSAVMLAGIYGFINAEQTALTTIPPLQATIEVFVPQTPTPLPTLPPTLTPAPTAMLAPGESPTWNAHIGPLFASKCVSCHGAGAMGGLNLATYADAVRGGQSGPLFIPGNAAGSL